VRLPLRPAHQRAREHRQIRCSRMSPSYRCIQSSSSRSRRRSSGNSSRRGTRALSRDSGLESIHALRRGESASQVGRGLWQWQEPGGETLSRC
jgi:hypothetical protein